MRCELSQLASQLCCVGTLVETGALGNIQAPNQTIHTYVAAWIISTTVACKPVEYVENMSSNAKKAQRS